MGILAGVIGHIELEKLKRVLGSQAQFHTEDGCAVSIANSGGEPAVLSIAPDASFTASIGNTDYAGCAAAYSSHSRTLALSCDPFGLHTLYTLQRDNAFWFASDLRILHRLCGDTACLDPVALHGYLCFSYVPTPKSVLLGVETLPAGRHITVHEGTRRTLADSAGWTEKPTSEQDQDTSVSQLQRLLQESVLRQSGAEREVGVFLSGGLDSSLIAALLLEAGVRIHLFTLDFGAPCNIELPYAQQVAAHLGRPLQIVPCGIKQVKAALLPAAAAMYQPFGDGVIVPLFLLGKAAAQMTGIVFNGEGGDQLFGGWNNKPMIAAELYGGSDYDREDAYLATFHRFHGLTDRLYTPRARAALRCVDAGQWVREELEQEGFHSLLHRLRAANLKHKGAQNIAPRARQLAEAHGLRVRSPFFDPELAHWSFSLPPEWFLQGACEKYLLKRVAERYLPAEVVWREKRGMGVPTTEWCQGGLRWTLNRLFAPRRLRQEGWLEPGFIRALRKGEEDRGEFRRRRRGEKLWPLTMLAAYQEAHGCRGICWEEDIRA